MTNTESKMGGKTINKNDENIETKSSSVDCKLHMSSSSSSSSVITAIMPTMGNSSSLSSILFVTIVLISFIITFVYGSITSVPSSNDYLNLMMTNGGATSATTADTSSTSAKSTHKHQHIAVGEMIEETGFYQSIRLTDDAPLVQKQSLYQFIEIRRSQYYGKVLILDGVMQLTERDADSYNEMMAHVAMFQHRAPKHILIIGGGDGYVLREVLKHASVQHVDHVDLDGDVINVCKEYFPWSHNLYDDTERVTLHIADGAKFVHDAADGTYDVIIQDSSDPWTWGPNGEHITLPSSVLYSPEHMESIYRILKPDGIFVMQAEAIQVPSDLTDIREWRQLALRVGFENSRYGTIIVSSYPTGQIGFLLNEKNSAAGSTQEEIEQRYTTDMNPISEKHTSYYHPALQSNTFVLPKWAHEHIYNDYVDSSPSCLAPET